MHGRGDQHSQRPCVGCFWQFPRRFRPLETRLDQIVTPTKGVAHRLATVADAYLAVVANWTRALSIDLKLFPNVEAHQKRVFARPAAGKAVAEEFALYQAA